MINVTNVMVVNGRSDYKSLTTSKKYYLVHYARTCSEAFSSKPELKKNDF